MKNVSLAAISIVGASPAIASDSSSSSSSSSSRSLSGIGSISSSSSLSTSGSSSSSSSSLSADPHLFRRARARVERLSSMNAASDVELLLRVTLADGLTFTTGAEGRLQVLFSPSEEASGGSSDVVVGVGSWRQTGGSSATGAARVQLPASLLAAGGQQQAAMLQVESRVFYCDSSEACRSDNRVFEIPLASAAAAVGNDATPTTRSIDFSIAAPPPQPTY